MKRRLEANYIKVKLLEDKLSKVRRAGKFIKLLDEKDPKAQKQRVSKLLS